MKFLNFLKGKSEPKIQEEKPSRPSSIIVNEISYKGFIIRYHITPSLFQTNYTVCIHPGEANLLDSYSNETIAERLKKTITLDDMIHANGGENISGIYSSIGTCLATGSENLLEFTFLDEKKAQPFGDLSKKAIDRFYIDSAD